MCVVIVRPPHKEIPIGHLENGNRANPHGWGVMARLPGGQLVQKRGFSTTGLVAAYNELGSPDNEVVVHCRIGTSGTNDLKNTHPFKIVPGTYLFHNGVFGDIKLTTKGRSDTWHLAQQLRPLFEFDSGIHHDEKWTASMTKYCTQEYPNKLVIMTTKDTVIINSKAGVYREGVWYSNHSAFWAAKVKPITTYFGNNTGAVTQAETIVNSQLALVNGGTSTDSSAWNDKRKNRMSRTERRAYHKRANQIMRLRDEDQGELVHDMASDMDSFTEAEMAQLIVEHDAAAAVRRANRQKELQEAFEVDHAKWEAHIADKIRSNIVEA